MIICHLAMFFLSVQVSLFYITFKGYSPFTVITKYWLYFLCCTAHLYSLSHTQQFVLPTPPPNAILAPSPGGNHKCVLCICEFTSFLLHLTNDSI